MAPCDEVAFARGDVTGDDNIWKLLGQLACNINVGA